MLTATGEVDGQHRSDKVWRETVPASSSSPPPWMRTIG
jgi:hypothetical protein